MNSLLRRTAGILGATVVLVVVWELGARLIASPALPTPLIAISQFASDWAELWPHALVSLRRVLVSLVVGTALALPLGLWIGRSPRADALAAPLLFLTYPIPKVVFLPVLMVLLGLGDESKVALIALVVFFQVVVTARDAARAINPGVVLSMRSLGATPLQVARHVVVPATLPEVFTALRIGIGTAVAVLFLSESIAGTDGLGAYIVNAWGMVDYPSMFAGIIAMALLGAVLYEALDALETRLTRWRRTAR